jgi:hypothetical protein
MKGQVMTISSRAIVLTVLLMLPARQIAQQVIDLCGCAGDSTLQPFNAGDPATYPPGTIGCTAPCGSGTVTLALPTDGVLKFSSFRVDGNFTIGFARNAANSPVTILVSGDVLFRNGVCCPNLGLNGGNGSNGTGSTAGVGGLGSNGGFKGADGAAQSINLVNIGGTGLGPAGGQGATPTAPASGGTFLGLPELLPLLGGSGGGGGTGFGAATSCTGGGGGGGGGGLLIVANGTVTLQNYDLMAEGGHGGSVGNGNCDFGGGGGSGGAIRLVASRLVDGGNGRLWTRGGNGGYTSHGGTPGRIRLESLDASAQTAFFTSSAALRVTGPGPIANPISPTVRITAVGGQTPPAIPQGGYGAIDVMLPAPGVTGVDVATTGVPSGTTVLVTVKPRIGGHAQSASVPLTSCNTAGDCTATTAFTLSAGAYAVEARATFQIP